MARSKSHKNGGRKVATSQKRLRAQSPLASATKSKTGDHVVSKGGDSAAGEIKSVPLAGISPEKEVLAVQHTSSQTASLSEKKTSRNNIFFLIFFLVWIVAYLGCETPLNYCLGYPEDQSLVKEWMSILRAGLNFMMALVVLVVTFWDRGRIYKQLAHKTISNAEEALNSMFLPFALALVPLTTASVDFGESIMSGKTALNIIPVFILVVVMIDYALLKLHKLNINTIYRVGKLPIHIIIFSLLLFFLFVFNVFMDWSWSTISLSR